MNYNYVDYVVNLLRKMFVVVMNSILYMFAC